MARTGEMLERRLVAGGEPRPLVVLDPRVSYKFSRTFYPSPAEKIMSWGERLADLGAAVLVAVREQSIDNGPMLVLTVVGILLVAFMLRT